MGGVLIATNSTSLTLLVGGRFPKWNEAIILYVNQDHAYDAFMSVARPVSPGAADLTIEIVDLGTFSDALIADGHFNVAEVLAGTISATPPAPHRAHCLVSGHPFDGNIPLSGKAGEGQEGSIHVKIMRVSRPD